MVKRHGSQCCLEAGREQDLLEELDLRVISNARKDRSMPRAGTVIVELILCRGGVVRVLPEGILVEQMRLTKE